MSGAAARVTIVTRTKNREALLRRCAESALSQTFKDWQHVVVNDGGDATSVEAVFHRFEERYAGRLRILHNERSMGMQNASNRAIAESDSEYIVIHDDDDSWSPRFLEACVAYLDKAGPSSTEQGVATQSVWTFEEIDSRGKIVELSRRDYYPFKSVDLFQAAARNPFPPIAFVYRRSVHEKIGRFDQQFNELGDWDFNLRFLRHYDIGVIDERLASYHWRHRSGGSAYGNTVTDKLETHRLMASRLRNFHLRRDMDDGRFGLGLLLNLSADMDKQMEKLGRISEQIDGASAALAKLDGQADHFERITSDLARLWKAKDFAARFKRMIAGKIRGAVGGVSAAFLPEAQPPLEKRLADAIAGAAVVSFDVFDTAILRRTRRPKDVFLRMEADARLLLGKPTLRFAELRVSAEAASRDRAAARSQDDTTLGEIYNVIREWTGADAAVVRLLMETEVAVEKKLCYANPVIQDAYRLAKAAGQRVVFASDMYLPAETVKDILISNGYGDDDLLISSELRATKQRGLLYDELARRLAVEKKQIVHVGDNEASDFMRAREKGLKAFHWTRDDAATPLVEQRKDCAGSWERDLASSLCAGLVAERRIRRPVDYRNPDSLWRMIGYEVIGPLCHAHTMWAIARARQAGVRRLFFLARDGFLPMRALEKIKPKEAASMEVRYLYASRRLLNVPRIKRLDDDSLAFLLMPNPRMRAKDFLQRLGLDEASDDRLYRHFGFDSPEQSLTTPEGTFVSEAIRDNLRKLMLSLERPILSLAAAEREKLLAYFDSAGFEPGDIGVVDMGWQASSLKSLQELLGARKADFKLRGFFFGTWRAARAAVEAGALLESLFFHLDDPPQRSRLVGESVELLESFFRAPHPTVVGLRQDGREWQPVYGEEETDERHQRLLGAAAEAALEFCADANALMSDGEMSSPPFAYLETVLERLLRYPRREEAEQLGGLALRNTFGGRGPLRHLAKPPRGRESLLGGATAMRDAYEHCYWKSGFLAQLSPEERAALRV